jgi:pyruvate kinase
MQISAIVTTPPYADFLDEVASHPIVSGFRLNTVMPVKNGPREALERLSRYKQPLWVDLKGRQLRVVGAAIPPFTEIQLSHKIRVRTPVDAYFSDGTERSRVVAVREDHIILEDGPRRLIGPGESVNIMDPSLEIEGTLTATDKTYLAAMKETGHRKIMLSYVETMDDVLEVKKHLPDAEVLSKIETQRGLTFAEKHGTVHDGLIAARGDLFVEVLRPHRIAQALKTIIQADPNAIAASRIFDSLAWSSIPVSADIGDVAFLLEIGYRKFMLGDQVCLKRDSVMEALNLLMELARDFQDR